MKKNILLILSIFTLNHADNFNIETAKDNIDCNNLDQIFKKAATYAATRDTYIHRAAELIENSYQKCKEVSEDKATLGKMAYGLGQAYRVGKGVNKSHVTACKYYNDFINNYADTDSKKLSWAEYFIADGARFAKCEEKNFEKANALYKKVIANTQANTNAVAWCQGRLGDAYREGEGVEQSYQTSFEFFNAILENDKNISDKSIVAWAKIWVADYYTHGKHLTKDILKAKEILQDVADNYQVDPWAVDDAKNRLAKMQEEVKQ